MTQVECHKCGWEWNTDSEAQRVTCPGCQTKVEVSRPTKTKAESPNLHKGGK